MGERSIAPMVSLCSLLFDATLKRCVTRWTITRYSQRWRQGPTFGLHVGPVTLRDNSVQDTPAAPSLWRSKA